MPISFDPVYIPLYKTDATSNNPSPISDLIGKQTPEEFIKEAQEQSIIVNNQKLYINEPLKYEELYTLKKRKNYSINNELLLGESFGKFVSKPDIDWRNSIRMDIKIVNNNPIREWSVDKDNLADKNLLLIKNKNNNFDASADLKDGGCGIHTDPDSHQTLEYYPKTWDKDFSELFRICLLYTSPSPRD